MVWFILISCLYVTLLSLTQVVTILRGLNVCGTRVEILYIRSRQLILSI